MKYLPILITLSQLTYSCLSLAQVKKDSFESDGCPGNITIKMGQSYSLKLPAIEGTGYLWIPKPSPLLSWNEEEKYEKGKADSNADIPDLVGSPTRQILTCKGLKIGKEFITIEYVRPFGIRKPEKLCQFELNVTH